MLRLTPEVRTFRCPGCESILLESAARCGSCGRDLDAAEIALAADGRERFLRAFAEANSLRITAGSLLPFLGLSLVPYLSLIGTVGTLALMAWVPISAVRWWLRFGKLQDADPELALSRKRVLQSLGIWFLVLLVMPFWVRLRFRSLWRNEG